MLSDSIWEQICKFLPQITKFSTHCCDDDFFCSSTQAGLSTVDFSVVTPYIPNSWRNPRINTVVKSTTLKQFKQIKNMLLFIQPSMHASYFFKCIVSILWSSNLLPGIARQCMASVEPKLPYNFTHFLTAVFSVSNWPNYRVTLNKNLLFMTNYSTVAICGHYIKLSVAPLLVTIYIYIYYKLLQNVMLPYATWTTVDH